MAQVEGLDCEIGYLVFVGYVARTPFEGYGIPAEH